MHHLYLSLHNNATALQQERESLVAWCEANGVKDYDFIEDDLTIGRIPEKRIKALIEPINRGDTIVVSQMSRLGRSLLMFQMVMNHIRDNECTIITLDGRTMEPNRTMTLFVNALNDIVEIEHQMKACRTVDIVHAKRTEGIILGRPQGAKRRPEKTVLYGKEDQLRALAASGHIDKEIAQILGISIGTIIAYRKAHNIPAGSKVKKGN